MGQCRSQAAYDQSELDEFQDLTYFTKREVLHVQKRFASLNPKKITADRDAVLTKEEILHLPELAVNPFKERILEVFSDAGNGNMNFEQFLEMMSQLSSKAPLESKITYAFKIYDFNGDGHICESDLQQVIMFLAQPALSGAVLHSEERQQVIENKRNSSFDEMLTVPEMKDIIRTVIEEMDMDNDGVISYLDFKHGMSKQDGFLESFKITL